jgi:5-methylcytosine-specific restriction endonuclease McrA
MRATDFNVLSKKVIQRTSSFKLKPVIIDSASFKDVDDLIHSVRKFYLLLPIDGFDPDWPNILKSRRRLLIKKHLDCVCKGVTSSQVQTVDRWLNKRFSPRESLKQFGNTLQKRYGNFCFICGKRITKGPKTVDHIFPYVFGGDEGDENLILAHPGCNSSKNAMIPGDQIHWAPKEINANEQMIPTRLGYLVFLRDNFTCSMQGCDSGLFTRSEITIRRKHETGICCYDNLKTVCTNCFE